MVKFSSLVAIECFKFILHSSKKGRSCAFVKIMIVILGCINEKERAGGKPSALQKMDNCIGDPFCMITKQDQLSW